MENKMKKYLKIFRVKKRTYNRTENAGSGLTKSQAEWRAAFYRSVGKKTTVTKNMNNGTYTLWTRDEY
jgi:hypothetical protein